MKNLQKVAIRQNAIYLPHVNTEFKPLTATTMRWVVTLRRHGFNLSEPLLQALNQACEQTQKEIEEAFQEILGTQLNWAPLVKDWKTPTKETALDHWITAIWNVFGIQSAKAEKLACGHIIPPHTFPLERYNGCPFCGTPFEFEPVKLNKQGSKLKYLDLWTEQQAKDYLAALLGSKVALDAKQTDSLKILLSCIEYEQYIPIKIKETLMLVIDTLVKLGKDRECSAYFTGPTDILRYLWYKKTGLLQIVEPKTLIRKNQYNHRHLWQSGDLSLQAKQQAKVALKLKYNRKQCAMVAYWLNSLAAEAEKTAEIMHPKRNMWVRFIRALRLAEYSKRAGFEKLRVLLDVFYHKKYRVWQGEVEGARRAYDTETTFALLKQRPGLFARSLFANLLHFGVPEITLEHFKQIVDQVPMRLILTLNMYAESYFDPTGERSIRTVLGTRKTVPTNKNLTYYQAEEINLFCREIESLCLFALEQRFRRQASGFASVYIEPALYEIPLPLGDRAQNIQDFAPTLMGEKFPLEGENIRLFMQWGRDLPAQHLDMDLSCRIIYTTHNEDCSFYSLSVTGCLHSGDIRVIPDNIGTAEYINIDIQELKKAQAKYIVFTCNAYSTGSITPNLVVGWMDSKYPMKISKRKGAAYDPSCVIRQVRISAALQKGLAFGVLDIEQSRIIWLELPFDGQLGANLSFNTVKAVLDKLNAKTTIGRLLELKAKAQDLTLVNDKHQADEVYDMAWARKWENINTFFID